MADKETKSPESLTEGEVNEVLNAFNFLEFSSAWRDAYNQPYATPDIINQQIKNINMNPIEVTVAGIQRALKAPKESEQLLRDYATSTELQSMYYKRLVRYIPDMAAFNMKFDVIGVEKESEFKSAAFKKDLAILDNFSSRFDFREEFATVLRQLFRQGIYYCILRDDGVKFTLQELPPDFCKITGRHPYGMLFDFDMQWFIGRYGVDINMYPPVFKKMIKAVFRRINSDYNPHKKVDKRNSTFAYWHQCSPIDGFWAWKISPEIATIVPYYSPMFADINFEPTVRKLQNDKYFIEASKILAAIIGFNKENKSGNVANAINMTPDLLGKFLGVAKQGLDEQIKIVALPVDDIKGIQFDVSDTNIVSDYTSNLAKQGSAASDSLFSTNKLNTHQSKLAAAIDMNFLYSLYPMFASFVEYFVNLQTEKYKFRVSFHDANTPDNEAYRMDRFKQLATFGIVDIQEMGRAVNMTAFELDRALSVTKTFGLDKKLLPLMQLANQQVSGDSGASGSAPSTTGNPRGRPPKPNSDNDNTQASIARGSNDDKIT